MPIQNEGTERFAQAQKPDREGKGTRWFRGQGSLRGSGQPLPRFSLSLLCWGKAVVLVTPCPGPGLSRLRGGDGNHRSTVARCQSPHRHEFTEPSQGHQEAGTTLVSFYR